MKWIGILLTVLLLASCNPFNLLSKQERKEFHQKKRCERKQKRYAYKCGVDSVLLILPVHIDSSTHTEVFNIPVDTSMVDSISRRYESLVDSLMSDLDSASRNVLLSHHTESIRYVAERFCFDDTLSFPQILTIMIDGDPVEFNVTAQVFQTSNDEISVSIVIPEQDLHTTTKVEVLPPVEYTFKEQIARYSGQILMAVSGLIILILLILAIRKLWKNIVR